MSILPLSDYKGEPLYKIVFIADHESDLAEAKQLYADQFVFCGSKLDSLTDGFVNGELINRKFDKGTGIKAICDYLGCSLADTIGFGDSDNDLQMTDVVGISVCMANGSENLKKRCDRIAPSVYEDGVAKEFKALGLNLKKNNKGCGRDKTRAAAFFAATGFYKTEKRGRINQNAGFKARQKGRN